MSPQTLPRGIDQQIGLNLQQKTSPAAHTAILYMGIHIIETKSTATICVKQQGRRTASHIILAFFVLEAQLSAKYT